MDSEHSFPALKLTDFYKAADLFSELSAFLKILLLFSNESKLKRGKVTRKLNKNPWTYELIKNYSQMEMILFAYLDCYHSS